jgi:heterotetrameric sarcosine oxidase delta subunit
MLRSWGGIMDMTMDGSPIICKAPIEGLYLNGGWCYGGFKATPASGWCFAHTIAKDAPARAQRAFTLDRFARGLSSTRKARVPRPAALRRSGPCASPAPIAAPATSRIHLSMAATRFAPDPGLDCTDAATWHDYVFLRDNPRGRHAEYWHHVHGCRRWLRVERDTVTHEIESVEDAAPRQSLGCRR